MQKALILNTSIDSVLVTQTIDGNEGAFTVLAERYLDAIYGQSLRYMGHQADAEDATQDAFVKIWKNLKKYNPNQNFKNWALEITKNTCLDLLKKKQVIPFSVFETAEGTNALTDTLTSHALLPDRITDQSLLKHILARAKGALSDSYRQVVDLYYDEGLNFREIAEQLGAPLHTVKSRHRRSILLLKRVLQAQAEDYQ